MPTGEGCCQCGGLLRAAVDCITGRWRYCPACHVTQNAATHTAYDSQWRPVRWRVA